MVAQQCRRHRRQGFNSWVGKISRRRAWQPTPIFFPGESHGQRSLAGCSPWGCKESGTTERLTHARPALLCFEDDCIFRRLRVCADPASRESGGAVFPRAPAQLCQCLILVILEPFQTLHQPKDYNLKAQVMGSIL